jgi:flagellar hook-basal body complex protein FliE
MNTLNLGVIPGGSLQGAGGSAGIGSKSLGPETQNGGTGFSDILRDAVQTVDSLHNNATSQVEQLMQGKGGDINGVMVAVEKADISFQLMMQVRNKIVSAYQDIEKMQF